MKKARILFAILLSLLLTVGVFTAAVQADFGDYGGDYDYGGFDSYDSGNDYNDYDYGNDNDNDDDYRYYGGTSTDGSGGSSDGGSGTFIVAVLIAVGVLAIVYLSKRKNGKTGSRPVAAGAQATDPSTLRPMAEYLALDPQFSEEQMREKLSNMYVQFQNAWQSKDMETLRPYLTDALYAKCDRQLDAYRTNRQTNRIERISVLDVQLMGFKQQGGMDMLVARLKTRIVDYVVNDADGQVIRGSNTAEKFMDYEWDLVRTSGTQTGSSTGTKSQNCPQCGAPININRTAKCEYCGCILTTDTFDWAVSEIKGISQRTAG